MYYLKIKGGKKQQPTSKQSAATIMHPTRRMWMRRFLYNNSVEYDRNVHLFNFLWQ